MQDAELARNVLDSLLHDQRLDASRINVAAYDDTVVLSGVVDSFHERWDASEDAWRVRGVTDVRNDINVDDSVARARDEQLAAAATAALDSNGLVPKGRIDVGVRDGWVTMTGAVRRYAQRNAADRVVRGLPGVYGVTDLVTVGPDAAASLADRIATALAREAAVDPAAVSVTVAGGLVTLIGTVDSAAQAQAAERIAQRAPGVAAVFDQLEVRAEP